MNVNDLAYGMLESPGRQFDIGKAITLALEVPVYFEKPKPDITEIVARYHGMTVGFAMLFDDRGELLLENPLWGYGRENLDYATAVGIEVHLDFRGRGIAAAMLSSAIRAARLQRETSAPVVARSAGKAVGFYKAFGFDIIETPLSGSVHYGARYVKADVPDINVKSPDSIPSCSPA